MKTCCPSCGEKLTGKPSFKWDLSREEYQEILGERFIWWMERAPASIQGFEMADAVSEQFQLICIITKMPTALAEIRSGSQLTLNVIGSAGARIRWIPTTTES